MPVGGIPSNVNQSQIQELGFAQPPSQSDQPQVSTGKPYIPNMKPPQPPGTPPPSLKQASAQPSSSRKAPPPARRQNNQTPSQTIANGLTAARTQPANVLVNGNGAAPAAAPSNRNQPITEQQIIKNLNTINNNSATIKTNKSNAWGNFFKVLFAIGVAACIVVAIVCPPVGLIGGLTVLGLTISPQVLTYVVLGAAALVSLILSRLAKHAVDSSLKENESLIPKNEALRAQVKPAIHQLQLETLQKIRILEQSGRGEGQLRRLENQNARLEKLLNFNVTKSEYFDENFGDWAKQEIRFLDSLGRK